MKTIFVKPKDIVRKWYLIDAKGKILGRLAAQIATILRGKHKPSFSPHQEMGDYVVVINADQIVVTGRKETDKLYYRHSGYPGGLKSITLRDQLARYPERVLQAAVKGMLPKNKLGRRMMKKLKVYATSCEALKMGMKYSRLCFQAALSRLHLDKL